MNRKKEIHSIVIVSAALVLLLILLSSAALAAITEKRITTHGTAANPEIYGNKIVYQDNRSGYWNIYMYDVSTKKETQLTNSKSIFFSYNEPDIYINSVVWEYHYLSFVSKQFISKSDIYMYDLSTKKQTKISTSGKAYNPKIYGSKIVWQDKRTGNDKYDICMYDLSTKKETRITTSGSVDFFSPPDIYANKVVYFDYRNGNGGDIYLFDLSTKKESLIAASLEPAIYGNKIVYRDSRNNICEIYMYDLSTKRETRITNGPDAHLPAIYGNRIVWQESFSTGSSWIINIYMYDVSTKKKTQITKSGKAEHAAIYDKKIVWVDKRNGNPDIYFGMFN